MTSDKFSNVSWCCCTKFHRTPYWTLVSRSRLLYPRVRLGILSHHFTSATRFLVSGTVSRKEWSAFCFRGHWADWRKWQYETTTLSSLNRRCSESNFLGMTIFDTKSRDRSDFATTHSSSPVVSWCLSLDDMVEHSASEEQWNCAILKLCLTHPTNVIDLNLHRPPQSLSLGIIPNDNAASCVHLTILSVVTCVMKE